MNDDIADEQSALKPGAGAGFDEKAARLAAERKEILAAVANVQLTTVQKRVAWLLNHIPEARDSDITLQLRYWENFATDIYQGGSIRPEDLYRLPRLTSLARARATIQNSHGLFLASKTVRKHRGTLREEERDAQREARAKAARHSFSVFVDESGKTSEYIIVGSCWLLNGIESRGIARDIDNWRKQTDFTQELHFSKIGRGSLSRYLEALDILYKRAPALSFKAISLPRRGLRDLDGALNDMLYHLLVRGVEHEVHSGRAVLPRTFQLWKDSENEAQDALSLANLKDRLIQASDSQFGGELYIGELFAIDSRYNPFLQFADLFVSSTNRALLNPTADGTHPKDRFSQEFLERFGVEQTHGEIEARGDVVIFEDV